LLDKILHDLLELNLKIDFFDFERLMAPAAPIALLKKPSCGALLIRLLSYVHGFRAALTDTRRKSVTNCVLLGFQVALYALGLLDCRFIVHVNYCFD
jgi:hypothetical protein